MRLGSAAGNRLPAPFANAPVLPLPAAIKFKVLSAEIPRPAAIGAAG
jgi:hypothetical protein